VKIFLPKRYSDVVLEEELEVINSKRVILYLIYKGTCPKTNSYILEMKGIIALSPYISYISDMDAMDSLYLLHRLAVGELQFIHTLEVFNPYTVVDAKRISVGPHRCCILEVREGDGFKNVLLATPDAFSEDEAFNISVGLTTCVTLYTGSVKTGKKPVNS